MGKRISQRDKVRPAEDCFDIKEFVLKLVSLIVSLYFPLGGEKTFRDCLRDCLRDSENEIVPKLFAGFSKKIWRPPLVLVFMFCCIFHFCNQQK